MELYCKRVELGQYLKHIFQATEMLSLAVRQISKKKQNQWSLIMFAHTDTFSS